ncbi:hypothetical protein C6P40_003852 [Pichia californica]|uniref:Uncharacterized protein n=1 Tax=Pichia californica TaxID=460514 RepID=A0A9P6WN69_9ASCO|nr:hypothetical protein C6P40_003852 [[Candida] californica]
MLLHIIKPLAFSRGFLLKASSRPSLFSVKLTGPSFSTSSTKLFYQSKLHFNKENKDSKNENIMVPHQGAEIPAEIYEKKQVISRRIPGETPQENNMDSRLPSSFNFEKEAIPTLLPRPGVPAPNKYPLARLYDSLTKKTEPELIYEAEPHKLYFVFCYAFSLLFIIYGLNAFNIGYGLAWAMYEDNDMKLAETQLNIQLAMHLSIVTILSAMPIMAGIAFILAPSRLVRRMWYLPPVNSKGQLRHDGQAFVKFTTHPLLPNRPTPVHIFPLGTLQKSITAKIYSGKGFYGTNDSSFFFFLREAGRRIPFIVDRKGFFWGDGRVFDLLFSDDSIEKVESAKKIDEVYGDLIRERKHNEMQMRKELGFGWKTKAKVNLMKEDIEKLKQIVSGTSVPSVKKDDNESIKDENQLSKDK